MQSYRLTPRVRTLIRRAMELHGFDAEDLSTASGIHYDTIRLILKEDGGKGTVRPGTMAPIADALALNLEEIREATTKRRDFYNIPAGAKATAAEPDPEPAADRLQFTCERRPDMSRFWPTPASRWAE
jgi:hypothetical protein